MKPYQTATEGRDGHAEEEVPEEGVAAATMAHVDVVLQPFVAPFDDDGRGPGHHQREQAGNKSSHEHYDGLGQRQAGVTARAELGCGIRSLLCAQDEATR